MEDDAPLADIGMYITQGCLVVPIQMELNDTLVRRVQERILHKVNKTQVSRVVIDVSGVVVIDSYIGQAIFDTAKMAQLLGATAVITGFRPGVVASLIDLNFESGEVPMAANLEAGLKLLESMNSPNAKLKKSRQ